MQQENEFVKRLKQGQESFKKIDFFGTPIRVNLEGNTTYKTCFGAILTVIFAAVMITQMWMGFYKMLYRTDPDYSFYKLTESWYKDDPLNIPDIGGQMYIGLLETKEYKDGSKVQKYIDFDPAYVNGKIDYYDQSNLLARKDMPNCVDRQDFANKIQNSNGLSMDDFAVMRCIPAEFFQFYNVAGTSQQSSITLLFEECGGKYQKSKEFEIIIQEQAEQEAIAEGKDPETVVVVQPVWEWTDPNCPPSTDCSYGLETPPEIETDADGEVSTEPAEDPKIVYEDCSEEQSTTDEDCVEYWDIQCPEQPDIKCLNSVVSNTCVGVNCQINFLRAFCEKYELPVCKTKPFQQGLQKLNGCLPGEWSCLGFQEMFGGAKGINQCAPWDLSCTLIDQYGDQTNLVVDAYPYMSGMPKSTLTIDDIKQQEYIVYLKYDLQLWQKGLRGENLSNQERKVFHSLGSLVMGAEGFNSLYQSVEISRRIQSEIDSNTRLFNTFQIESEPTLKLASLEQTSLKIVEWNKITQIMAYKLDSDIWSQYFFGNKEALTTREVEAIKIAEAELYGSEEARISVYDKNVTPQLQIQIDENMKKFIWEKRVPQLSDKIPIVTVVSRMPFTKVRLEEFARIEVIKEFLIIDLWNKAFVQKRTLTSPESQAVSAVGIQLFSNAQLYLYLRDTTKDFSKSQQDLIDTAHRAFIERYQVLQQSDIIYKGPKGDILGLPISSLTAVEWSEILKIMQYKLGSDAFERKFTGIKDATTLREDFAIKTALIEMFGSESFYELWKAGKFNTFSANQAILDRNTRSFINDASFTQDERIVARMPETTLTLVNMAMIEEIIKFKIGGLWLKVYDYDDPITDSQKEQVDLLGNELMGAQAYAVYKVSNAADGRDLTKIEQVTADAAMKFFIENYRPDVEIATARLMPLTSLTVREWDRITQLLDFNLGENDLWERFVSGEFLDIAERSKVNEVGSEWMGSGFWLQYQSQADFNANQQLQVDANSRLWIEANKDVNTSQRRILNIRRSDQSSRKFLRIKKSKQQKQQRYNGIKQHSLSGKRNLFDSVDSVVTKPVECASAQEIRQYLQDKTIVVFAAQSFVKESDDQQSTNEMVTFLEPVAEKRLDFKYHKSMEAVIQKQNIEIQDSYYQIFLPESEILTYPLTRVQHEDVVTREYWDGEAEEYVNTQESMLAIKLWLETTTSEQKRIAYDSMTLLGDIGGFYDFIVIVITPCVGILVGDRLTYYLLAKLFMINKSKHGEPDSDESNNSDPEAKKKRWKSWIVQSEPYKADCPTQMINNNFLSLCCCKNMRPNRIRSTNEKLLENGKQRVIRDLDIRNLIKAQDLLRTLTKLKVKKREKRKLMRLQKANVMLECDSDYSFDSEDDFKDFKDAYSLFQFEFDELIEDDNEKQIQPNDMQHMKLFRGVLERDALDPSVKPYRTMKSKLKKKFTKKRTGVQIQVKRTKILDHISEEESAGTPTAKSPKKGLSRNESSATMFAKEDPMGRSHGPSHSFGETIPMTSILMGGKSDGDTYRPYDSVQKNKSVKIELAPLSPLENFDGQATNRSSDQKDSQTQIEKYGKQQLGDLADLEELTEQAELTLPQPGPAGDVKTVSKRGSKSLSASSWRP